MGVCLRNYLAAIVDQIQMVYFDSEQKLLMDIVW